MTYRADEDMTSEEFDEAYKRGIPVEVDASNVEVHWKEPDTLHEWLHWRYGRANPDNAGTFEKSEDVDDELYWRHEAAAVRRAVERGGWKNERK